MISLINRRINLYSRYSDIKSLEELYRFFKEGYDDLSKLLDDKISLNEFWNIVKEHYNIELFEDELHTYLDCKKLDIKPKRLQTEFITYTKESNMGVPRYRFEDWIVMETGKFDGRRIYSKNQIKNLIETNQIVPLYMDASRPSSGRLELVENANGFYDLYYNGHFVVEEEDLDTTYGNVDNITYYPESADLEYGYYNNPIIQSKLREKIFTKEKVREDIEYYRFRALEVLKLIKNQYYSNLRLNDAIEAERYSLTKKI